MIVSLISHRITATEPMDDLASYAIIATSAFFVTLAFGLLFRYLQISQKISASTDLGHDLWEALETRLRKQDERILDMMGRVGVIQARVMGDHSEGTELIGFPSLPVTLDKAKHGSLIREGKSQRSQGVTSQSTLSTGSNIGAVVESRLIRQDARIMEMMKQVEALQSLLPLERVGSFPVDLKPAAPPREALLGGSKEKLLIQMLSEEARTSVEIRQQFSISREHAARLLKSLFDRGLVLRNDSRKPFVYELTEAGRRYLSAG